MKEIPLSGKKEAKLQLLLHHPSLPNMVDYVERGEFGYLVMEYIRGKSLSQWMEEGRSFSLEELLGIAGDVAEVLDYLHKRKPPVYYGDLKPENLMLTQEGKLYLVDLGSAVQGYRDLQQVCLGTRGYAAPEQYQGRMNAASDVYAFGKTLWALMGRKKWNYLLRQPGILLLVARCCRKKEKNRISNMETIKKKCAALSRMGSGLGAFRLLFFILLFMGAGLVAAGILFLGHTSGKPQEKSFPETLTEVTQRYYEPDFQKGSPDKRKDICKKTEKELQEALKRYSGSEEQKRLLLLLALNAELAENEKHTRQYYEQLLLYHPDCEEGYEEYGSYLWRIGKWEESLKCYQAFEKVKKQGLIGEGHSPNWKLWEERIHGYLNRKEEKEGDT